MSRMLLRKTLRLTAVAGCIVLANFWPPCSYLMLPNYHEIRRRDAVVRVDPDLQYFGAI